MPSRPTERPRRGGPIIDIADSTLRPFHDPGVSTDHDLHRLRLSDQRTHALAIARMAEDKHADDVVVLEVAELTAIATHFILATARNPRLGASLVTDLVRQIRRDLGLHPRVEGRPGDPWVVLDCMDIVIHVLAPEARQFYQLERLWADAPTIATGAASAPLDADDASVARVD